MPICWCSIRSEGYRFWRRPSSCRAVLGSFLPDIANGGDPVSVAVLSEPPEHDLLLIRCLFSGSPACPGSAVGLFLRQRPIPKTIHADRQQPDRHVGSLHVRDGFDRLPQRGRAVGQIISQLIVWYDDHTRVDFRVPQTFPKMRNIAVEHRAPPGHLNFHAECRDSDLVACPQRYLLDPIDPADLGLRPSAGLIETRIYLLADVSRAVGVSFLEHYDLDPTEDQQQLRVNRFQPPPLDHPHDRVVICRIP